jgi:hypothetical protein
MYCVSRQTTFQVPGWRLSYHLLLASPEDCFKMCDFFCICVSTLDKMSHLFLLHNDFLKFLVDSTTG